MESSLVTQAAVQSWNSTDITVSCPYCEKTHKHGFGKHDGRPMYNNIRRKSNCRDERVEEYKVVFPFDMERNVAAYEINKKERTFVSIKELPVGQAGGAITRSEVTHQKRPHFKTGSKREVSMPINGKQITHPMYDVLSAVEECILGKVDKVEMYLKFFDGKNDYTIFLRGEDDYGFTALCLAATGRFPDMVQLLLRHGSDVNARNHEGRTPLMEAALWGRAENVRILLNDKADKTLRDLSGKLAIDLAQICRDNEEERYRRAKDFKEVAYLARLDRQQIIQMLEPLTQDQLFGFGAPNNDGSHDDEHVASLHRGTPFPRVKATNRDIGDAYETVVGGRSLTQLVSEIAELVGHQRCSASHAGKQLIAYFIDKHVFLPGDVVDENELNDLLSWGCSYEDEDLQRRIDLAQLKRARPPVCLRHATIWSSTAACRDCKDFCERVNNHFDLELDLQPPKEDWFIPREEVHIGEKLAVGSFGTVHLGKRHETEVVVKVAIIDDPSDGDQLKRLREMFLNEVRVWQRARHPHIVRFIGAYHDCSSWFIVSENASGGTLTQYLYNSKANRTLVWHKLCEVALGLHFLHEQKIVHSDVKSNNILVSSEGKVMLSDFGLSFEQSGSCVKWKGWGAIRYRPPEYVVKNGAGPSFAGDVYSLGMCIVEAVTGQPPWGSNDDKEVKSLLCKKEMLSRPPEMADPEWELVESMCAFEPSARMPLVEVIKRLRDLAGKEELERGNHMPSSSTHSWKHRGSSRTTFGENSSST